MLRKILGGMCLLLGAIPLSVSAETINQAKVKAIDYERSAITVTVNGKDRTFPIHKDAKTWQGVSLADLYAVHAGEPITLTVEKSGSKDFVKTLKLGNRYYYGEPGGFLLPDVREIPILPEIIIKK